MSRALTVWWDEAEVGELALNEHGTMTFRYAQAWLADPRASAVSISLPRREEPFNRAETRPFFAGLLPEEKPREAVARTLGVSRENDFGLLERLGGEVAGALALWPTGEVPPRPDPDGAPRVLDEPAVAALLEELPRRPLRAGEEGVRLSLAGAQAKAPVILVDGAIALPAPGQPTTHIIKPAPKEYPTFPENEAFCMRLAAELGLPVAPVELRRAKDQSYLLVERYDRALGEDGRPGRIHQEDFCQALGVTPEHKYAAEGGPNFQDSFNLLRRAIRVPAGAILQLVDAALFNLIIGNADAHAKNFSLLYFPTGLRLAPLYDLLSTAYYPEVHAKMAMKMGGAARLEEFTPDTLGEFARQADVALPYVRRRAADLARRTPPAMKRVAGRLVESGLTTEMMPDLMDRIADRAAALLSIADLSDGRFLDRFDEDIAADRFDSVATAIKAFRDGKPAVSRFAATRLAGRVFSVHPGFREEGERLDAWLETQPEWREGIGQYAADPARLGGKVQEALDSLKRFSTGAAA